MERSERLKSTERMKGNRCSRSELGGVRSHTHSLPLNHSFTHSVCRLTDRPTARSLLASEETFATYPYSDIPVRDFSVHDNSPTVVGIAISESLNSRRKHAFLYSTKSLGENFSNETVQTPNYPGTKKNTVGNLPSPQIFYNFA